LTLRNTDIYSYHGGIDLREGRSPSLIYIPPSLNKGRGPGGWVSKQSLLNQLDFILTISYIVF